MYQKFLVGTLTKEVAKRRFRYWTQLTEMNGTNILISTEDRDSEKDGEEARGEEKERMKGTKDAATLDVETEKGVSEPVEVEPILVV